jgi:hypothetical protein
MATVNSNLEYTFICDKCSQSVTYKSRFYQKEWDAFYSSIRLFINKGFDYRPCPYCSKGKYTRQTLLSFDESPMNKQPLISENNEQTGND